MTTTSLSVVQSDAVIVSLMRASTALAEAKTLQQTKKILDVAAAAEIYAKRQHLGEEAEAMAVSIKVEALRKLGEMLKATPKATGTRTVGGSRFSGGTVSAPPEDSAPTLAELGLTKKESAVAQKLAALPEKAFEQVRDGHVTVSKAIAAVEEQKKAAKKPKRELPVVAPREPDLEDMREAVNMLGAENDELKDRLAVAAMDATAEERTAAAELIGDLRKQIAVLTAEKQAMASTRDSLLVENGELKRQVAYWRRKAEKVAA